MNYFEFNERVLALASYILTNNSTIRATAKHFNILYNDNVKIIELITPAADDKHSGMFNTKNYKWVN